MNYQALLQFFPRWVTKFEINGNTFGGEVDLTNDARIHLLEQIYPLRDKRILELGCLEGGHSLMLSRLGTAEVVAIEGRVENYIKCCLIKNLFGLTNCQFLLMDVEELTPETLGRFDCCVAIGILYHLKNPALLLHNLKQMTAKIYVWTHVANENFPQEGRETELRFSGHRYKGRTYSEFGIQDPLSGLEAASFWPYEPDLLEMVEHAGFKRIQLLGRSVTLHGPACLFLASGEREGVPKN